MKVNLDSIDVEMKKPSKNKSIPSSEESLTVDIQSPPNSSSRSHKSDPITSAKDLLILREKRKSDPELKVSFSVGGYTGIIDSSDYWQILNYVLTFVDACLYLEDSEGNPRSKWAVARSLRALNIEIPDITHEEYMYLEPNYEDDVAYFPDRDDYKHLWALRHRAMETE